MLQEWKDQYQALRMSLRNANIQAKVNVEKAAKDEREQLLSGGEDATLWRRQLQYVIFPPSNVFCCFLLLSMPPC
jgi:protein transport protein SEC20